MKKAAAHFILTITLIVLILNGALFTVIADNVPVLTNPHAIKYGNANRLLVDAAIQIYQHVPIDQHQSSIYIYDELVASGQRDQAKAFTDSLNDPGLEGILNIQSMIWMVEDGNNQEAMAAFRQLNVENLRINTYIISKLIESFHNFGDDIDAANVFEGTFTECNSTEENRSFDDCQSLNQILSMYYDCYGYDKTKPWIDKIKNPSNKDYVLSSFVRTFIQEKHLDWAYQSATTLGKLYKSNDMIAIADQFINNGQKELAIKLLIAAAKGVNDAGTLLEIANRYSGIHEEQKALATLKLSEQAAKREKDRLYINDFYLGVVDAYIRLHARHEAESLINNALLKYAKSPDAAEVKAEIAKRIYDLGEKEKALHILDTLPKTIDSQSYGFVESQLAIATGYIHVGATKKAFEALDRTRGLSFSSTEEDALNKTISEFIKRGYGEALIKWAKPGTLYQINAQLLLADMYTHDRQNKKAEIALSDALKACGNRHTFEVCQKQSMIAEKLLNLNLVGQGLAILKNIPTAMPHNELIQKFVFKLAMEEKFNEALVLTRTVTNLDTKAETLLQIGAIMGYYGYSPDSDGQTILTDIVNNAQSNISDPIAFFVANEVPEYEIGIENMGIERINADFDNDGIADMALSNTGEWGNQGGGLWCFYIKNKQGLYTYIGNCYFHPFAMSFAPLQLGESLMAIHDFDHNKDLGIRYFLISKNGICLLEKKPQKVPVLHKLKDCHCKFSDYLVDKNAAWEQGFVY